MVGRRLGLVGALAGCEPEAVVIADDGVCGPIAGEPLPGGAWLVEGDIMLAGHEGREAMSDRSGFRSAVKCAGTLDRTWDVARRLDLSFCLGRFTDATLKARTAAALGPATAQWERAGGMNFIRRAEFDGEACRSPEAVAFVVREGREDECGASGCPLASASFPPETAEGGAQLVVWPEALQSESYTLETVVLHELGHLLGLVHEHSRFEQSQAICVDAASQVWRGLTFPDPASVMGDARCPGIAPESTRGRLSAGDRLGAWTLYAPPRGRRTDFDGDRAEDLLWWSPGGESYELWFGGAGGFVREGYRLCEETGECRASRSWRPIALQGAEGRTEVWMFGSRELADERWTPGPRRGPLKRTQVALGARDVPIVGAFTGGADVLWWLRPGPGEEVIMRWDQELVTQQVSGPEGYGWPLVGRWRAASGSEEVLWLDAQDGSISWWSIAEGERDMVARTGLEGCGLVRGAEQVARAGDFTGEGLDEALWWDPRARTLVRWRVAALWDPGGRCQAEAWSVYAGAGGLSSRVAQGDFDGDGAEDLLWFSPEAAELWGLRGAQPAVRRVAGPREDATPCVGDFNGDGCDDVLWHTPGTSGTMWRAACSGDMAFETVSVGQIPAGAYPVGCGG